MQFPVIPQQRANTAKRLNPKERRRELLRQKLDKREPCGLLVTESMRDVLTPRSPRPNPTTFRSRMYFDAEGHLLHSGPGEEDHHPRPAHGHPFSPSAAFAPPGPLTPHPPERVMLRRTPKELPEREVRRGEARFRKKFNHGWVDERFVRLLHSIKVSSNSRPRPEWWMPVKHRNNFDQAMASRSELRAGFQDFFSPRPGSTKTAGKSCRNRPNDLCGTLEWPAIPPSPRKAAHLRPRLLRPPYAERF
eukprot:Hpha_TRINITY_DN13991_c0_g1::TRINITY_DN13991_c0_g1_i1::g.35811::m.35811